MKSSVVKAGVLRIFQSFVGYSWIFFTFALMSFTSGNIGIHTLGTDTNKDSLKAVVSSGGEKEFQSFFAANNGVGSTRNEDAFLEISPKAVPFVQEYSRRESSRLEALRTWGQRYLKLYDGILEQYGLPKELKYLSVIESDLKAKSVSVAGATGPWQIMAAQARNLGLKINGRVDERRDYTKSTHAAAKMLKSLYGEFGDWLLVIAAYNAGPSKVQKAMRKHNSSNFWDIQYSLPKETRNHVKKFIATHYILEGEGGVTTLTAAEIEALDMELETEG